MQDISVDQQPHGRQFCAILIQSHLRHCEWSLAECGLWSPSLALARIKAQAKTWGKRHVQLLVSDRSSMKEMLKGEDRRDHNGNQTKQRRTKSDRKKVEALSVKG